MIVWKKKNFLIRFFLSFLLILSGFYFEQCSKKEKTEPKEFPKVPNPVDCTDVDTRLMFKEVGIDLDKLPVFSPEFVWTHSAWVVWNNNQLEQLYYNGDTRTKISRLPEKIGCEKKLISLRLPKNNLTFLPESIGELYALEELDLQYSWLKALPENFSYLRNLKKLHLLGNRLQDFPEQILVFKKLQNFWLCGLTDMNQDMLIPEAIKEISSLTTLCLPKVSENKQKEILTWFENNKNINIQFL